MRVQNQILLEKRYTLCLSKCFLKPFFSSAWHLFVKLLLVLVRCSKCGVSFHRLAWRFNGTFHCQMNGQERIRITQLERAM